ncbi:hypothetical protein AEAC466_06040 [Asticcacaulis sp. AC466]|uniref:GNAT family N-acetyltransferase n=1 Tax=Asticcacaulis sp. AC466 TaxID=1282362 RepID=UPI0003C3FC8F|nr:GNAT family N-acetyltransferase [Asticcacaulis sp. AC466]ESQ85271.1 hypothetical protein AEAC466_06040 [Asticcacaulis sp. AC466]
MSLHNAKVSFEDLDIGGRTIRIAIPGRPNVCWVTSLATAIGPMAREEIDREMDVPESLAAKVLSRIFETFGRWLRIDEAVFVEHRLLSTSLYTHDMLAHLVACRESLMRHYPGKAIVLRSLNAHDHAAYIDRRCWPFRVVWIIDDIDADWATRRDARRDVARLETSNLDSCAYDGAIPPDKLARCLELYRNLYLGTYSGLNPDYDYGYLRRLMEAGDLEILTLEDKGRVEAFCALHSRGDTLSVPMVGYNQSRPQSDGLYRSAMTRAAQAAQTRGMRLNLSAGAPHFKRHRGAKPYMEYVMIIEGHLPAWRRFGYSVIGRVLRLMAPELLRSAS